MNVVQTETLLERTDQMLKVITSEPCGAAMGSPARDVTTLWNSGLSSSLLFSVDDRLVDSWAESEAHGIVMRHLERTKRRPANLAMTEMVDFQHALQSRSKVMSAIEMLTCG